MNDIVGIYRRGLLRKIPFQSFKWTLSNCSCAWGPGVYGFIPANLTTVNMSPAGFIIIHSVPPSSYSGPFWLQKDVIFKDHCSAWLYSWSFPAEKHHQIMFISYRRLRGIVNLWDVQQGAVRHDWSWWWLWYHSLLVIHRYRSLLDTCQDISHRLKTSLALRSIKSHCKDTPIHDLISACEGKNFPCPGAEIYLFAALMGFHLTLSMWTPGR